MEPPVWVGFIEAVAALIFRCPNPGQNVQGWLADDALDDGADTFQSVTCTACSAVRLVNPKTGKTLGADDE